VIYLFGDAANETHLRIFVLFEDAHPPIGVVPATLREAAPHRRV
jgi:hypothetical protein